MPHIFLNKMKNMKKTNKMDKMVSNTNRKMEENEINEIKVYERDKQIIDYDPKKFRKKKILMISFCICFIIIIIMAFLTFFFWEKNKEKIEPKKTQNETNVNDTVSDDTDIIICDIGYFIPSDNDKEKACQKCKVENCKICSGTKEVNECTLCQDGFTPIIENNIIKYCSKCETGTEEKCLSCNYNLEQCSECNPGYFIPENDEIKKIAQNAL